MYVYIYIGIWVQKDQKTYIIYVAKRQKLKSGNLEIS